MPGRVDILGVGFDRVALVDAVTQIEERLDLGKRTFVITANPEFVMLCRDDRALAGGSLVFVIGELFSAGRKLNSPLWNGWGIGIGFLAGLLTDFILVAVGA